MKERMAEDGRAASEEVAVSRWTPRMIEGKTTAIWEVTSQVESEGMAWS